MAFEISENLIDIYQDGIDSIINQLGKKVVMVPPQNEIDCPNCYYDGRRRKSSNRKDPNNPNPAGPLNKDFTNGQICKRVQSSIC